MDGIASSIAGNRVCSISSTQTGPVVYPLPPQFFMREKGSFPVIWPGAANEERAWAGVSAAHMDLSAQDHDHRGGGLILVED